MFSSLQKSLQDLDLLSFHNQRLTKRIENLQNQAATKAGGSWLIGGGGGSAKKELEKSQSALEAATLELQAKIEENENLHQQLYEINALYPRHVTELQGKIQTLEKQNQELQLDVERAGVANEDTINLIRKEKDTIEKELGKIRDVLAGELKDEQHAHQSLREKMQRLESDVERLSKSELAFQSLQVEHQSLQGELETFKWISSEFTQLQQSYSQLERDKGQIEKAHAQLSQQHASLKQAEENLRRALAQEQEAARGAQEQNQRLNRDIEHTRATASEQQQSQKTRIEQLESELGRVRMEQGKLQQQYEELKVAEQSAKEGESRTKLDLAKDLEKMRTSLEHAETKVKEVEQLREALEKELTETKKALEDTRISLKDEQQRKEASGPLPTTTGAETDNEAKTEGDEGQATEEDASENRKAPLSKKAKKKKKAAAAAAAAAAAVGGVEASESSNPAAEHQEGDAAEKEQDSTTTEESTKAAAVAKVEAAEAKRREEEQQARKAAEDALKAEIEALRAQIKESEQSSATKLEQLSAAKVALETAKDEKASLSSSLEMHVELTMQLQQEIDGLKEDLAKKQKHGANGALARGSAPRSKNADSIDGDDEPLVRTRNKAAPGAGTGANKSGDQTPIRSSTPVSTADKTEPAAVIVASKDASSQVDRVEALDKAIQSEKITLIDEGTQADLERASPAAAEPVVKESAETNTSETGVGKKVSRRSMIGDGATVAATPAGGDATATHQSNREYLIKQHYETKIQSITEQLQLSDGRYARLHKEFGMLKELLLETVQGKESVLKECEQLKSRNLHLQDELATAKEDNRAQVEMMTNYMKSIDQGR
ncbi:hypothetical protein BGZ99_004713 [Dissophora globulifera]|uniref:Uncharacterized protein n=1 Tax=Dissophora globulifera TaxID=979702 RepID=A0A9P6RH54_9FUNG|nr:hypothetical protein BGZ99_004713 [Dissophora globulifera]